MTLEPGVGANAGELEEPHATVSRIPRASAAPSSIWGRTAKRFAAGARLVSCSSPSMLSPIELLHRPRRGLVAGTALVEESTAGAARGLL